MRYSTKSEDENPAMLKPDDLERARATFLKTRQIWFADNFLDAHERLAHYPFALHNACDECLKHSDSPSAVLNRSYARLAHKVSEELHFLIRWAAHIGCGGRDR